jgi:hypothetical protein
VGRLPFIGALGQCEEAATDELRGEETGSIMVAVFPTQRWWGDQVKVG